MGPFLKLGEKLRVLGWMPTCCESPAIAAETTNGCPAVVVDWKSDVDPDRQTHDHYRSQVRTYLDVTGAAEGLIVLMTTGTVVAVSPSARMMEA